MVVYRSRPVDAAEPQELIISRLEECWMKHGAFDHEAHAVSTGEDELTLEFVN